MHENEKPFGHAQKPAPGAKMIFSRPTKKNISFDTKGNAVTRS